MRLTFRASLLVFGWLVASPLSAQERGEALDAPTAARAPSQTPAQNLDASVNAREVARTEASTSRTIGLEVMLGTTAPLDLGVAARVVFFERLYAYVGLGVGIYGGLYDAVASGLANDDAGAVARSLGNGAFVGRLGVGVRPFGAEGLELSFGYLGIRRGVTVDAAEVAAAAGMSTQPRDVDASLRIRAIQVELGWSLRVGERLLLRPTVGWAHGLKSRVGLSAEGASAAERAALASIDDTLTRNLDRRARTPTLGLQMGLRF
ncbi:MAG: hypothetical protein H6721_08380 [Sandaracinus sp.]|nr:hypothetical protein [Sandaracinus sp.]MCB9623486.1 hypothetical protein [Sandaracinus sp.]MCB9632132.1 hypothetical protein [Sandaracinus sp.]